MIDQDTKSANLALWHEVEKTDPAYTKGFKGKGGFQGTAICAQWQRRKATELWGPYGGKWKMENPNYQVMDFGEDFHLSTLVFSGNFMAPSIWFTVHAGIDLWVYSVKYKSWSKNNDVHKKVATDALTKALSMLGFSSDVFLGLFDDNKYVTEIGAEFDEEREANAAKRAKQAADARNERLADWRSKMEECTDKNSLRAALVEAKQTLFRDDWSDLARWSAIKAKEFEDTAT